MQNRRHERHDARITHHDAHAVTVPRPAHLSRPDEHAKSDGEQCVRGQDPSERKFRVSIWILSFGDAPADKLVQAQEEGERCGEEVEDEGGGVVVAIAVAGVGKGEEGEEEGWEGEKEEGAAEGEEGVGLDGWREAGHDLGWSRLEERFVC